MMITSEVSGACTCTPKCLINVGKSLLFNQDLMTLTSASHQLSQCRVPARRSSAADSTAMESSLV